VQRPINSPIYHNPGQNIIILVCLLYGSIKASLLIVILCNVWFILNSISYDKKLRKENGN
jgi:hypothetical protein